MKKIIAIAASPNKGGNSDTLLEAFIKGAKSASKEISFEKIYICDIPMHFFDHPHKTVDEKEEPELFKLTQKMQKADGYIIATPTYNFNVPSQLKNLIDRIGFFSLNYQKMNMVGQPTGLLGNLRNFYIVTGGTPSHLRRCLFCLFPGFWLKAVFMYYGCFTHSSAYAGGLTFRSPAKEKPKLLKKFEKFGEKYAKKFS